MAKTIVRQLGGAKDTVINRKTVCHSPQGERVTLKVGTIPKKTY